MSDQRQKLNFRSIAKQIAESDSRWPTPRVHHVLFAAFWRGDFEQDGQPKVTLESWHSPETQPATPATRAYVVLLLPTAEAWIPEAVRGADRGKAALPSFPWDDLASLPADDYEPTWRLNIMERIAVSRSDYEPVARKAGLPMPKDWRVSGDDSASAEREPGRPGARHLYLPEHRRRVQAGEAKPNVQAEARCLVNWLKSEHPQVRAPKPSTIARELYRARRAGVGNSE